MLSLFCLFLYNLYYYTLILQAFVFAKFYGQKNRSKPVQNVDKLHLGELNLVALHKQVSEAIPKPRLFAVMKMLETLSFQAFGAIRTKKVWGIFLGCRLEIRKRQNNQYLGMEFRR